MPTFPYRVNARDSGTMAMPPTIAASPIAAICCEDGRCDPPLQLELCSGRCAAALLGQSAASGTFTT